MFRVTFFQFLIYTDDIDKSRIITETNIEHHKYIIIAILFTRDTKSGETHNIVKSVLL